MKGRVRNREHSFGFFVCNNTYSNTLCIEFTPIDNTVANLGEPLINSDLSTCKNSSFIVRKYSSITHSFNAFGCGIDVITKLYNNAIQTLKKRIRVYSCQPNSFRKTYQNN